MKMENFLMEPEKPSLEQEMQDKEFRKKLMDSQLPVMPSDEYFDNKNTVASKGTVKDLTGK